MTSDIVVVGAGPIGSAAARHLAQRGFAVTLVGPGFGQTDTVFSSHHDQGRVCRIVDRVPTWTALNAASLANLQALEEELETSVLRPTGCLLATNDPDHGWFAAAPELEVDPSLVATWPYGLPGAVRFGLEGPPAGILRVPELLKAQHSALQRAGGTRHVTTLRALRRELGGTYVLDLADGTSLVAPRVLLCTGAYVNRWLEEPLDVVLETETTLLVPVDPATEAAWSAVPTLLWDGRGPGWEGPYVVPPLRFGDGHAYVKIGGDLSSDQRFLEVDDVDRWFRHGDSASQRLALVNAAHTVLPGLPTDEAVTARCILTRTAHAHPMIGEVAPSLWVGVGGHGWGAMASDGIGELVARAVAHEPFPDDVPASACAVAWRDRGLP